MGNIFYQKDYFQFRDLCGDWYVVILDNEIFESRVKFSFKYDYSDEAIFGDDNMKSDLVSPDEFDIIITIDDIDIKCYGKIKSSITDSEGKYIDMEYKTLKVKINENDLNNLQKIDILDKIGKDPEFYTFTKIDDCFLSMTVDGHNRDKRKEIVLSRLKDPCYCKLNQILSNL